jgi:hypothetical protein
MKDLKNGRGSNVFTTNTWSTGMMSRERPTPRPTLKPPELEEIKIRILKVESSLFLIDTFIYLFGFVISDI